MALDVLALLSRVFTAVVSWFELVITGSGFGGIYLGAVFMVLLGKFLLQPLFGSAGSDQVKRKKE